MDKIETIEIDLTGQCNLKCSFCPRAFGFEDREGELSMETLEKICESIEELPYEVNISMSGHGEPTLHTQFDKVIERLRELKDVRLSVTTNGAHVSKWKDTFQLLDTMCYNVYTNEQAFYKAVQQHTDYNMPGFVSYKEEVSNNPLLVKISTFDNGQMNVGAYDDWASNRAGSIPGIEPSKGYCSRPFEKVYIKWNGDYLLCCEDWDEVELDNIHNTSILDYYNNNNFLVDIQKNLLDNTRIKPCSECSYYDK